ncbi:MAG: hypothetical protein M1434_06970 [Chloroflexi bacterium]|nr:hypothetical protein [Chloroflexota bacterium]MCL5274472.1 hypothetical protein [Chloroflexota bacterium]
MGTYTQTEFEALISRSKQVTEPPRRDMRLERGHLRNDLKLRSDDDKEFTVFMRINEKFQENFTIGLTYHPLDEPGTICLLRCNGRHGEHINNPDVATIPHFGYHVHVAQADMLNMGQLPERFAELTAEYASYEEALVYFIRRVNILEAHKYFNNLPQLLPLFDQREKS